MNAGPKQTLARESYAKSGRPVLTETVTPKKVSVTEILTVEVQKFVILRNINARVRAKMSTAEITARAMKAILTEAVTEAATAAEIHIRATENTATATTAMFRMNAGKTANTIRTMTTMMIR